MTDKPDAVAAAEPSSPPAGGRAKRDRRAPEVFRPEVKEKEEFIIKQGAGSKLGDIPNVKFKLNKRKPDDDAVLDLHRALYSRPGVATKRKRDILQFSGYVFGEEEEKEKAKQLERLCKLTAESLGHICDILDLPQGGKKDERAARVLEFLMSPKVLSDKNLAELEEKKKEVKKRKQEKAKTKAAPKAKKAKKAKKAGSDEDEADDDEEEEQEEEEEEGEEQEEVKPMKASKKPAKGTVGKKAKVVAEGEEEQEDEEGDGEEEAKAVKDDQGEGAEDEEKQPKKKAKKEAAPKQEKQGKAAAKAEESPSDSELRSAVEAIVAGVDASAYSFKSLMVDLGAKFPGVKFSSSRKQEIKGWLVELIANDDGAGSEKATAEEAKAEEQATEPVQENAQ